MNYSILKKKRNTLFFYYHASQCVHQYGLKKVGGVTSEIPSKPSGWGHKGSLWGPDVDIF